MKAILDMFRKKCKTCLEGRLVFVNSLKMTRKNEKNERYPDSVSFYECETCKRRFKIWLNGKIEQPSDAEWTSIARH